MPLMSHKFRLRFENYSQFTRNVSSFNLKMKDKTIAIELRHPNDDYIIYDIIDELVKNNSSILLDHMNQSGNLPVLTVQFSNCVCNYHSFELAYKHTDVAIHKIILKYKHIIPPN